MSEAQFDITISINTRKWENINIFPSAKKGLDEIN